MAKILIVEDDKALRDVFELIVKSGGHNVRVAQDGADALKRLPKFIPDIILLDMLMPVKSGLEFLQEANLKKAYPAIVVIILSNLSDSQTIQEALKLGAVKHLIKSDIMPDDLLRELKIHSKWND
ncbi:MAG: DNA-binding response regulator VicR [Candidatus Saccharibacteria bacterium]|nr:DNA-binding response regulator VicR [Candidatus Saccharibacteria bacterium]